MTLSRIHLPSISSVLTSERAFLPGQFVSTKLGMDAAETKSLPDDFLMRTIHLDEAPCVGHQVSSFSIGHNLDTIIEEGESDVMIIVDEQPSALRGTSSRSSSSSNNLKHDRGVLASKALRILSSIKVVRSARRGGPKGRTFTSS